MLTYNSTGAAGIVVTAVAPRTNENKAQFNRHFMSRYLTLLLLALLCSCSSNEQVKRFAEWRNDANGCNGLREPLAVELLNTKEQLYKLTEQEIRQLLGAPDKHELYRRQQKFYFYFTHQGKQCDSLQAQYGQLLRLRFDPLNRVNEVVKWYIPSDKKFTE